MQISYNKTGGVIRYDEDDWLSGLVPYYANVLYSINGVRKGMSWAAALDPFRHPGLLVPGPNPTNLTNVSVVDTIQTNGVTAGAKAYTVGGDNVQEIDLTSNTITSPADNTISAHGGHTTVSASDICIYYIGTTKYAFYSWSDNTDGDVGRFDLASTYDDDYMSAVAASGAVLDTTNPHPLVVGDDDRMYIGDGRNLHEFDGQTGANGTLTKNRFQLPVGYIITSFAKTPNYLVIYAYRPSSASGTYYRSEATAFFWDYTSEDPTYKYPLQGSYVNGGFNWKGIPGCFVQGYDPNFKDQKTSKLCLLSNGVFEPIATFNEAIPGHGGVEVAENIIRWNAAGAIYQYGSLHGFDKSLNRIATLAGTTAGGMLKNFAGNILFASSGATTSGGLQRINDDYSASCTYRFPVIMPSFPLGYQGQIKTARVFWGYKAVAGASGGHKAKIYLNTMGSYAGANTATKIIDNSVSTDTRVITDCYYNSTGGALPIFQRVGWEVSYESGVVAEQPDAIQAIEIHYDNVKIV